MNIELITPDRKVFGGEADRIKLPGIDGLFEVLRNHAPMIAALKAGEVKITSKDGVTSFHIIGGFAEVLNNQVVVLAEGVKN